jgi:hypothetical protein
MNFILQSGSSHSAVFAFFAHNIIFRLWAQASFRVPIRRNLVGHRSCRVGTAHHRRRKLFPQITSSVTGTDHAQAAVNWKF